MNATSVVRNAATSDSVPRNSRIASSMPPTRSLIMTRNRSCAVAANTSSSKIKSSIWSSRHSI